MLFKSILLLVLGTRSSSTLLFSGFLLNAVPLHDFQTRFVLDSRLFDSLKQLFSPFRPSHRAIPSFSRRTVRTLVSLPKGEWERGKPFLIAPRCKIPCALSVFELLFLDGTRIQWLSGHASATEIDPIN